MTKLEIEQYLYKHIPITEALGVKALSFSKQEVKFWAPLSKNINHRDTAFGGSISSLLITTGWAYLRMLFDQSDSIPKIVISNSEVQYHKPVTDDFTSELTIPKSDEIQKLMDMTSRFGKGRITLNAHIIREDQLLATFSGDYAIIK